MTEEALRIAHKINKKMEKIKSATPRESSTLVRGGEEERYIDAEDSAD